MQESLSSSATVPEQQKRALLSHASSSAGEHRLSSLKEGESEVEKLAAKIETRRQRCILVTFPARVQLGDTCRRLAIQQGYHNVNRISREDLMTIRQHVAHKVASERQQGFFRVFDWMYKILGMKTTQQYLLEALDRAVQHIDETKDWFHYVEFGAYHLKVVSPFPWMRNQSANAFLVVILFFVCTPILFCTILGDENICVGDGPSDRINWIYGLYFGSVTISTVGYGDVKVSPDNIYFGILYIIVSICVSISAFSAAADDAFAPFERFYHKYLMVDPEKVAPGELIYKRIQRIQMIKLGEIAVHFILFNLIGVVVSRFFKGNLSNLEEQGQWTWAESIYWSVQSTTTIGYGDLSMDEGMRLFQVFYLSLGTFFVGNTLGKLATLKDEMEGLRSLYAWQQREVTREMIHSDQGDDHDAKIDQYEFVVASLLNLGKISGEDITPIMNKFRKLASSDGDKGYIDLGESDNQSQDANRKVDYFMDYKTFGLACKLET